MIATNSLASQRITTQTLKPSSSSRTPCINLLQKLVSLSAILLLSACTHIYDMTGKGIVKYGKDQMMPYFLSTDDPYVGCAMGEGMSPILQSFGKVTDEMTPLTSLGSGMCADLRAKEAELRYLRAMFNNNAIEAQDARTQQKRNLALAARRQFQGYQAVVRVYGEPGNECPKLKTDNDQFFWMLGLMNGMQAVLADVASESQSNLPMDTIPKVVAGIKCVDKEIWWGLPEGIQAVVQILMPTELPPGVDPYKDLDQAVTKGKQKGVRLVQMLEAGLYANLGDKKKLKAVIKDHIETKDNVPGDPTLAFLDAIATLQIRLMSDKLWTEATGQRTPFGKLGTFWDDPKDNSSAMDIDDLI